MRKETFWQRTLIPLFTFVWWNRLWYDMPNELYSRRAFVVKVKGWKTALIDTPAGRQTVTFCFKCGTYYTK